MSNLQRLFLALLGLCAASGVGVLLLGTAGGDAEGGEGLQLGHSPATENLRSVGSGETPLALV
ncbi:MAG: hypothetical protein V3T22_00015, partial [Planctomycetota bacterium]